MKAKVENLISSNGNKFTNQLNDISDNTIYFQSYNSIITKIENGHKVTLDAKYWNYSNTTSKYRNIFLGEITKETQKKVVTGFIRWIILIEQQSQPCIVMRAAQTGCKQNKTKSR